MKKTTFFKYCHTSQRPLAQLLCQHRLAAAYLHSSPGSLALEGHPFDQPLGCAELHFLVLQRPWVKERVVTSRPRALPAVWEDITRIFHVGSVEQHISLARRSAHLPFQSFGCTQQIAVQILLEALLEWGGCFSVCAVFAGVLRFVCLIPAKQGLWSFILFIVQNKVCSMFKWGTWHFK